MTRIVTSRFTILFSALFSAVAGAEPVAFDWFEYTGRDEIFEEPLPRGDFQNPILTGFYPDPSICAVGDDFYLVTSTFSFYPGVPIFHSKDLVNWRQLGFALDRPSQLALDGLRVSEGVFAPTIRHHDGVFYMIATTVQGINNFYVTAADPAGPWSDPKLLPWVNGIDPSFFFDDDGRVYITHNGPPPDNNPLYEGHRAVWLWEVDLETNQPIGEGKIIINGGVDLEEQPVWIEAPHVFKKDGWYYLTCAEGGTSINHSQVVFRTRSLDENWIPWENNPILTQRDLPADRAHPITSAGHADLVKLPNGEWWSVFLAIRPYEGEFFNTGRETYLHPVTWENGWPMILESGKEIPWRLPRPDLPEFEHGDAGLTGNFTWRDEFDSPQLQNEWNFLRTPRGNWLSIDTQKSRLLMQPRTIALSSLQNTSWLARRQQHANYDASSKFGAPVEGVSAGVAALIREDHYFYCAVRMDENGYVAYLEKADNGAPAEVATVPLPGLKQGDAVIVQIEADKTQISFYVEADGKRFAVAESEDATLLTTARAWGFVGAQMGPFARID